MASDPKLLYAIEGVGARLLVDGREESLTPSGPQTLSLLMVPTASGFADPASINPNGDAPEEDFYLHLHLPPELDLPLPATTQIYHMPPRSYLIPRWDLGPDSGAFTRLDFPAPGSRSGVQEDVDTFETILAQCTAFLERAAAPQAARGESSRGGSGKLASSAASVKAREAADEELPPYNPAEYAPGQGYAKGSSSFAEAPPAGRIVLVDEEDGSVIGEVEGFNMIEDSQLQPGSKDPVMVTLPQDGTQNIAIAPTPSDYTEREMHPAYKKSSIVNRATAATQLLVTTSDYVSRTLQSQADSFTKTTRPVKPVTFAPTTHAHIRRINTFSGKAAGLSSAAVGTVSKYAQNLGANIAKRKDGSARGYDKDGVAIDTYRPGVLNKSLMAFNTVIDGVEHAGRTLLTSGASSMSTVVGHRWGAEAGEVAGHIGGGVKNVGLVYIDVTGVSRRAILKSVAKGMVVGQVKGGGQVIVGGDGGVASVIPPEASAPGANGNGNTYGNGGSLYGDNASVYSSQPLLDRQTSQSYKGPF